MNVFFLFLYNKIFYLKVNDPKVLIPNKLQLIKLDEFFSKFIRNLDSGAFERQLIALAFSIKNGGSSVS